jgi:phosphate-selective porin OprO/OprP
MKLRIASLAALLAASFTIAQAEDSSPPAQATPTTHEGRLQALEQRNAILERKFENAQENAAARSFNLKISAVLQTDYRDYLGDHGSTQFNDQFLLRRVRPTFEGTVAKVVAFRFTPDFANGGGTTAGPTSGLLPDAWIELQYLKWAKLRIGKTKSPIGLEQLQSDPVLFFIERGLTTQLVPNRDTGVQLLGDVAGGAISYQAAVVNGVPDGATNENDTNDGKDYVGRLFLQPFKRTSSEWVNGLGFGIAGSIGDQFGDAATANLTGGYKSDGQQAFFRYQSGTFANGQRKRVNPEAYWYGTHLGVTGEYVASSQEIRRVTTSTATATVTNHAWQIGASYVLTGERPSFNGLKPRKPFDPKNKTWGALEVVGRYAIFRADDEAFTQGFASLASAAKRARSWTGGLNWYLNDNVRVSSDYVVTSYTGGAAGNNDRPTEKALLSRVQLTY